jgi:hypothetical protein
LPITWNKTRNRAEKALDKERSGRSAFFTSAEIGIETEKKEKQKA